MNCPSCNYHQSSISKKNYDLISHRHFEIKKCLQCHLEFTLFDNNIENISKFYPQEYYGSENKRFFFLFEILVKLFRFLRIIYIAKILPKEKSFSLLDIGCGRGYFLHLVKKIFKAKVTGIELSQQSANYATNFLQLKVVHDLESLSSKFDIITMWHSLEHMLYPNQVLTKTHDILNEHGQLVIEVPNINSWQARMAKEKWIYLETPRHLTHFSQKSLDYILSKNGFKIISLNTFSLEYGVFGMLESILNYFGSQQTALFMSIRSSSANIEKTSILKKAVIILSAIILLPIAFFLELTSILKNNGGVIRVIAKKSN
jgi:2-polyprenyl-3-methyl-5-hydroxy-6-metoxy-1,4-benzoquinol methylase